VGGGIHVGNLCR